MVDAKESITGDDGSAVFVLECHIKRTRAI